MHAKVNSDVMIETDGRRLKFNKFLESSRGIRPTTCISVPNTSSGKARFSRVTYLLYQLHNDNSSASSLNSVLFIKA